MVKSISKLSKNSIKQDQLVKNMAYPPPMALIYAEQIVFFMGTIGAVVCSSFNFL